MGGSNGICIEDVVMKKNINSFTLTIIGLNVLSVISCFCILCIENLNVETICRIFFLLFAVVGLLLIFYFFYKKQYLEWNQYGFSIGVLILILGCIGFIKSEILCDIFNLFIGFLVLLIGIFSLQWAIQLKFLRSVFYFVQFLFACIMIVCSILVILDMDLVYFIDQFPVWLLLISSLFNLLSLTWLSITILRFKKKKDNEKKEGEEDDQTGSSD